MEIRKGKYLNFHNMNRENREMYYWIYRIALLKYDLTSASTAFQMTAEVNSDLDLYFIEQLIVHFNEGCKLFRTLIDKKVISRIIDSAIEGNSSYKVLLDHIDFSNKENMNNILFKPFRDDIVHYKNSDSSDYEEFEDVVRTIKNIDKEIHKSIYNTELSIEKECQMLLFNKNIINVGMNQEKFSEILWDYVDNMILVCNLILNENTKLIGLVE